MEAEAKAHYRSDESGFARINSDTTEIKMMMRELTADLKSSIERIHGRIEETSSNARHALANEAQISRAGDRASMEFAQEAHNRISSVELENERNFGKVHIKFITGVALFFLGIAGWFADHFFGNVPHK